jgi:hypothetical protein
MYRYFVLILFVLLIIKVQGQDSFWIVNVVAVDKINELPVPYSDIEIKELNKKIRSDKNGQFKFAVPVSRPLRLVVSHPDYFSKVESVSINNDTTLYIRIEPTNLSVLIEEIETTAAKNKKRDAYSTGVEYLTSAQVKSVPSLGGEKDLLKALTMLPGFTAGTEGTTELSVRGGTKGENSYLLDGYTLYKSSHLMGLLSVYNPQETADFTAYKSGFPSKFGGWASSVIDVRTIDPDMYKFKLNAEVGLLTAKTMLQMPVYKGVSSILLSGRISYIDKIVRLFQKDNDYKTYNFYDLHGKWLTKFKNHELAIDFYTDNDGYDIYIADPFWEYDLNRRWVNSFSGLRLNSKFSFKVENNFQAGYSRFTNSFLDKTKLTTDVVKINKYMFKSQMDDLFIKDVLYVNPTDNISLEFGGEWKNHKLNPSEINLLDEYGETSYFKELDYKLNEISFFGDFKYSFNNSLKLMIGIRNSNYLNVSSTVEPRIGIRYLPDTTQSFSFSFSEVSQPLLLLLNSGIGFSTDIWLLANEKIKPIRSSQLALNWTKDFKINDIKLGFSSEIFLKKTINATEYKDGYSSNFFTSTDLYFKGNISPFDIITVGTNYSYGLELMLEKKEGKFKGWVSYTLSKSSSIFPELNNGESFPSKYDRRHNLSINTSYTPDKLYSFSLGWSYGSGFPLTMANYVYIPCYLDLEKGSVIYYRFSSFPLSSGRNSFRMKPSHSLNISASKKIKLFKKNGNIEIGVYNLYNNRNVSYYEYGLNVEDNSEGIEGLIPSPEVKSVSLLPIMPYFNLSIEF